MPGSSLELAVLRGRRRTERPENEPLSDELRAPNLGQIDQRERHPYDPVEEHEARRAHPKQVEHHAEEDRQQEPAHSPASPTMPVTMPMFSGNASATYLNVEAMPKANTTPSTNDNAMNPPSGMAICNVETPSSV